MGDDRLEAAARAAAPYVTQLITFGWQKRVLDEMTEAALAAADKADDRYEQIGWGPEFLPPLMDCGWVEITGEKRNDDDQPVFARRVGEGP